MIDLKTLPPPKIVEEPEFQALFEAFMERFKGLSENYAYFLPGDPVVELAQCIAYREMVWRNRNNEVAMANLLAFATGADLDHLGAFCPTGGVARLVITPANANVVPPVVEVKEDDEAYRRRIQLALASSPTAGTKESYLFHTLSASPLVKDALAYSPDFPHGFNMGGRVHITVLSREGNGVPSSNLLQIVEQAVKAEDKGLINDVITVEPARLKPLTLRVAVTLYPDTPIEVFNGLKPLFEAAFAKEQALGYEPAKSWIDSKLHVPGVQSLDITSPSFPIRVEPYEYPHFETLDITFAGFYFGPQFNIEEHALNRVYNEIYRFYRDFAIRNRRELLQILTDLSLTAKAGVIQPTLAGFATYLGITKVMTATGATLPADEIAAAIHFVLSSQYDKVLA